MSRNSDHQSVKFIGSLTVVCVTAFLILTAETTFAQSKRPSSADTNAYFNSELVIRSSGNSSKVDVSGSGFFTDFSDNVRITKDMPEFQLSDTQNNGTLWRLMSGSSAAGYFNIYDNTAAAYRLTIAPSGNVGIGTTSPAAKMHIEGDVLLGSYKAYISRYTTSDSYRGHTQWDHLQLGNNGPNLIIGGNTGAGGELGFVVNNTNDLTGQYGSQNYNGTMALYLKSSGNVGIGTTSPVTRFTTYGTSGDASTFANNGLSTFWNSNGVQLSIGAATNSPFGVFLQTKDANNGGPYHYPILLNPVDGNVGIGTTNPSSSRLQVVNSGSGFTHEKSTGGYFTSLGFNGNNPYLTYYSAAGLTIGYGSVTGGVPSVNTMTLTNGGNVGIGTDPGTYKLNVSGSINATGLNIDGSPITSSQWATSGGNINYTSGNVGIGTTSPSYSKLQLVNSGSGFTHEKSAGGYFTSLGFNGNNPYLTYYSSSGLTIGYGSATGGAPSVNTMTLSNAGYIGIGKPVPDVALDVVGDIKASGVINARYQDVAEWVESSEQLAAGTVVVLDSTKSNQVIASSVSYDTRVAGVISAQPGIVLGEKSESKVLVATTGRVKVKVDATKSPIHIGDLLVTSDSPGAAMKSEAVNLGGVQFHRPGTLIGKALEPLTKGKGEILVLLSLQ